MAQTVSHRPVTAESHVRSEASDCGLQGGSGTGFSSGTFDFSCVILLMLQIHSSSFIDAV
jgi:hypothetical protein